MNQPHDIDAANRYQAYIKGWKCGAKGSTPDPAATGHADRGISSAYRLGVADGHLAFNAAATDAAKRFSYEPSPLRGTNETT